MLVGLYSDVDRADPRPPSGMTHRNPDAYNYNCLADQQVNSGATGNKTFDGIGPIAAWLVAIVEGATGAQHAGGSPTSVAVAAAGAGRPRVYGGAGASEGLRAARSGWITLSRGAPPAPRASAQAAGRPRAYGGAGASVGVGAAGSGWITVSGGARMGARVSAQAAGRPGFAYGSAGAITTSSTGQGAPGFRAGAPMGTARVDVSGAG